MTIKEALKEGSILLENQKETRILLAHYLNKDPLKLILDEQEKVPEPEEFFALIARAKHHEPIEYITNKVTFYSKEFYIAKGALIPRPETELLLEKALQALEPIENPHIAEIGVGSGILSVLIAHHRKDSTITATDISHEAINIAKINAKKYEVEENITFVHTPYLADVHQQYHLIISNPPYIAKDAPLEKNLSYEPDIALYGGERGDEILKNIIDLSLYQKACTLCCEIGYDQKELLASHLADKGIHDVSFYQDLSGLDRGFIAKVGETYQS